MWWIWIVAFVYLCCWLWQVGTDEKWSFSSQPSYRPTSWNPPIVPPRVPEREAIVRPPSIPSEFKYENLERDHKGENGPSEHKQDRAEEQLLPKRPIFAQREALRQASFNTTEFQSQGEWECAQALRELFPDHVFRKIRPDWLMNDYPGRQYPLMPLELDLYCAKLNLAVEFNGRQHYELVPDFHGHGYIGSRRFYGLQQRDLKKLKLCRERGVDLIVIRYDVGSIRDALRAHPLIVKRLK